MLKKALKLNQVHIFGDISVSQLLEKIDLMTEIAMNYDFNGRLRLKSQILITIISLATKGLFVESDKD